MEEEQSKRTIEFKSNEGEVLLLIDIKNKTIIASDDVDVNKSAQQILNALENLLEASQLPQLIDNSIPKTWTEDSNEELDCITDHNRCPYYQNIVKPKTRKDNESHTKL